MSRSATILLIDDDSMLMNNTASVLQDAGYAVHTCMDWPKIAGMVRTHTPDLVLLDYNMPTIKGDQICETLRRNMSDRRFKIVIFSSENEVFLNQLVTECGADGYISKVRGVAHILNGVCSFLN